MLNTLLPYRLLKLGELQEDKAAKKPFVRRKLANACNHVALARSSRRATDHNVATTRYARGVCGNWRQRAEVTCIALFGIPLVESTFHGLYIDDVSRTTSWQIACSTNLFNEIRC